MADSDSLADRVTEGGDAENLKSESRLGSSVLVSMKELVRRMGEVLNVVDRGEKAAGGQTRGGVVFSASDFAYVPDPESPSTWKLPLTEEPGKLTVAQIARAITALQPGGFRGQKVEIPAGDLPGVLSKIRAAIGKVPGIADDQKTNLLERLGAIKTGAKYDSGTEAPSPSCCPFGNAQSFAEVDGYLSSMRETEKITGQTEQFRSIISNVMNDDQLTPVERAGLIAKAAQELPGRITNPPEYKAFDFDRKAVQGVQFVVGRRVGKTTMDLQTVIFDKQFWDATKARTWLDKNNLHSTKMDETENSLRFRQADPGEFQEGSFRTIQPGKSKKSGLKLFKDRTGATRWLSFSANAFKDKEGEIFSTKALEEAVEDADRSGQRGPLLLYHVPTAEIGQCDFQALEGRMLVESGTFADTILGQKSVEYFLAHADEEFEMSVGYKYRREDREDKVYDWVRIFERSITPAGAAANPWTSFSAIREDSMDEKRKKFLGDVLGPSTAEDVIKRAQEETKSLEGDVDFKTTGEGEEPKPEAEAEAKEPKPAGEGEELKPKTEGEEPKPEGEAEAEGEKSVSIEELTGMLKDVLGPVLDEVKSIGERLATVEGESAKVAQAIKTLSESDDVKVAALFRPRTGDPALAGKSATAGDGEDLTEDDKAKLEQKGNDPTDPYLAQLTGKGA